MKHTHWKKLTNPNYLGAYELESADDVIVATIKSVGLEQVVGADGKREECTVAHFVENIKPMILNVTNCKTITRLYKTPYIEEWAGRKIAIFKATVKAFGETVEALRIKPEIPKVTIKPEKTFVCADCGKTITAVGSLSATEAAQRSQNRFGKVLCVDCARSAAEDKTHAEEGDTDATDLINSLSADQEGAK